jgi:hypothetical protein
MEHRKFVEEELEHVRAESVKQHAELCQVLSLNTTHGQRVSDLENELVKMRQ